MSNQITLLFPSGLSARVIFDYTPMRRGRFDLAPEDCYPDEPAECDILEVYPVLTKTGTTETIEGPDIADKLNHKTMRTIQEMIEQSDREAWGFV